MGEIYKITCLNCEKEEEIYTGVGMLGISFASYYCPNCNSIKVYKETQRKKKHICKNCNTQLIKFKIKENVKTSKCTTTEKLICSKCKSDKLDITRWGFWD